MFENQDLGHWAGRSDRRSIARTQIKKGALLFFSEKAGVYPCTVRNVTNRGAGIRAHDLTVAPIEFALSFDKFRTVRMCRLIWRQSDFLGIEFNS